jgi:cytidylate kinase
MIERRMLLWNARLRATRENPAAENEEYRFVTVSRDSGSLGDEIAQALAAGLNWHIFDKELVNYISLNAHVQERLVQQLDEREQSLLQDAVARFLRMTEQPSFGSEDYHQALLKTLAYLATQGHAVLVGRGANFALRTEPTGLHVRISASADVRVERSAEKWSVSRQEARRRLLDLDAERRNFIRRHFQREMDDLRYYDAVFNTDFMSVPQVAACVVTLVQEGRRSSLTGDRRQSS